MKIDKQVLIDRAKAHRDAIQARIDKDKESNEKTYQRILDRYRNERTMVMRHLRERLDLAINEDRPIEFEELPNQIRSGGLQWLVTEPRKTSTRQTHHSDTQKIEGLNRLLAFLEAVQDKVVTEVGMERAGFGSIGWLFSEPHTPNEG